MTWENLHQEIAEEFAVYSTVSDERLDRFYSWSLNWFRSRQAAKYCDDLRFRYASGWVERRERFKIKSRNVHCLYCFELIVHDYEKNNGHIKKYCCNAHLRKGRAACFLSWKLPDGDETCARCQRGYRPSPLAPESGVCSATCHHYLMNGEWVPFTTALSEHSPGVELNPRPKCNICGGWDTPGCRVCRYYRQDLAKRERRKQREMK